MAVGELIPALTGPGLARQSLPQVDGALGSERRAGRDATSAPHPVFRAPDRRWDPPARATERRALGFRRTGRLRPGKAIPGPAAGREGNGRPPAPRSMRAHAITRRGNISTVAFVPDGRLAASIRPAAARHDRGRAPFVGQGTRTMPLGVAPAAKTGDRSRASRAAPSLNQAERDATAHFARLLCAHLAERPETERGAMLLLLVGLPAELGDATARLVPAADAAALMAPGETAVAWVPQGVPGCPAKRRALALRLASVGGVAWRKHRQIERLGFLAA